MIPVKIAMMQPTFMPWTGYFELIAATDLFIFLDNFQFSVQSYHQRNRLFVDNGRVDWYIVPVSKTQSFKSPLNETRIHEGTPWRKKMWMRIQTNYKKCEYFDAIRNDLQQWLLNPSASLAVFNMDFIKMVCSHLGLFPAFRCSSEFAFPEKRSVKVLNILRACGCSRYYSARGAFSYMLDDRVFPVPDIEVVFQDFHQQPYTQYGSPDQFIPFLSVLDPLLNVGPEKTLAMIQQGTKKWKTWDEMTAQHNYTSSEG